MVFLSNDHINITTFQTDRQTEKEPMWQEFDSYQSQNYLSLLNDIDKILFEKSNFTFRKRSYFVYLFVFIVLVFALKKMSCSIFFLILNIQIAYFWSLLIFKTFIIFPSWSNFIHINFSRYRSNTVFNFHYKFYLYSQLVQEWTEHHEELLWRYRLISNIG